VSVDEEATNSYLENSAAFSTSKGVEMSASESRFC
jgi:hypothetical protein